MTRRRLDGALLTAEQAARALEGHAHWELWDGIALVGEPAGGPSGPLGTELGHRLRAALGSSRAGGVGDASTGFLVRRGPGRLLAPHVSFTSRERLGAWPREGFVPCAQDLAAEIRSSTDSWACVLERGGIWIAHGVQVVWLVDPEPRRVLTLRPAEAPAESGPGASFTAAPVLPDLVIDVAEFFAILE
jgi:Uma2 family endonuclease